MARTVMPWVVGFDATLDVRRNNCTPGTRVRVSSTRGDAPIVSPATVTTPKAASVGAGDRRAAVTTTPSTVTGDGRSRSDVRRTWVSHSKTRAPSPQQTTSCGLVSPGGATTGGGVSAGKTSMPLFYFAGSPAAIRAFWAAASDRTYCRTFSAWAALM